MFAGPSEAEMNQASSPAGLLHAIEQISTLEVTLWSILEGLKSNVTYVSYFCREYWGTSASMAQVSLDMLDWNDRLKRQVQQACVLESLSLALTSHLCNGTMQDVTTTTRSRLRNLLYYVHENCTVLLDLMRQRWLSSINQAGVEASRGVVPENLNFEILIRVSRYSQLRRGEHVMSLRQHNEMIANIVRQLCRGAATKRFVPRGRGSNSTVGDRSSVGSPASTARGALDAVSTSIPAAVNEVLTSVTPLDRLRPRNVRSTMLKHLRFQPLLNVNEDDHDCPWPVRDPYERFGSERFATDGPIIWFEPLPPMMADLEKIPSLPPLSSSDTYTLVLDLDETLVHYHEVDGNGSYRVRPGMTEFLERMNSLGYEIVIFTAATQDYADWVIGQIDPKGLIHHRLYRQHALPWGPLFAKDLSRLGRNLDQTLIIDNVQENFMKHPENGIFISTWYEDPHDNALFELSPLLEELIMTRARVPEILDKYRDEIPTWAGFGAMHDRHEFMDGEHSYDEGEFDQNGECYGAVETEGDMVVGLPNAQGHWHNEAVQSEQQRQQQQMFSMNQSQFAQPRVGGGLPGLPVSEDVPNYTGGPTGSSGAAVSIEHVPSPYPAQSPPLHAQSQKPQHQQASTPPMQQQQQQQRQTSQDAAIQRPTIVRRAPAFSGNGISGSYQYVPQQQQQQQNSLQQQQQQQLVIPRKQLAMQPQQRPAHSAPSNPSSFQHQSQGSRQR